MNDYCVFILTHGRPDKILTDKTLRKCGYTGEIFYVVDDEDKTQGRYRERYGEKVCIFEKKEMADKIDEANNFDNRKVIVHARNYCFDLAQKLGYRYFIELDDDYYGLEYKYPDSVGDVNVKNMDIIFNLIFNYYKSANFASICLSQNGDFIGGVDNGKGQYRFNKRKCMNSFFCSTERRFWFTGSINEDVNTYTTLASRGLLFYTIPFVAINQKDTQKQKGGMSDIYLTNGTYIKSFTTVMMQPSSVKVSMMNARHKRLHHSIKWINTVPCIIREDYKKPDNII